MDKLFRKPHHMTLEEVEKLVYESVETDGFHDESTWAAQLLDVMQENERLRSLLKDAIEELEFDTEEKYSGTKQYPNEKRRYDRDMGSLQRYRDALQSNKPTELRGTQGGCATSSDSHNGVYNPGGCETTPTKTTG